MTDIILGWLAETPYTGILSEMPFASTSRGGGAVTYRQILDAALGGIVVAIASKFPYDLSHFSYVTEELQRVVEHGVHEGLRALGSTVEEQTKALTDFATDLTRCAQHERKAEH